MSDEIRTSRVKKTLEEKKSARRARSYARRLRRRAEKLGVTEDEVVAQRKKTTEVKDPKPNFVPGSAY